MFPHAMTCHLIQNMLTSHVCSETYVIMQLHTFVQHFASAKKNYIHTLHFFDNWPEEIATLAIDMYSITNQN